MSGAVRYCTRCGCYLPDRQQKCLACGAWDYPGMIREAREPPPNTVAILYADNAPFEFITESAGAREAWLRSMYADCLITPNDWRATYLGDRPLFGPVDSNTNDKE